MTTDQVQLAPPTNALAIASLLLGILANGYAALVGIFSGAPSVFGLLALVWLPTFVPGLLAVIFGFVGINTAGRLAGKRRAAAVWGTVLGFTPLLTWFITFMLSTFLFSAAGI